MTDIPTTEETLEGNFEDADRYQKWTENTAEFPKDQDVLYTALGLLGETGEMAEKLKKMIRDLELDINNLSEEELNKPRERYDGLSIREMMIDEAGDRMYYQAQFLKSLGIELSEVFERNVEKLQDRKNRNKIKGSGDTR